MKRKYRDVKPQGCACRVEKVQFTNTLHDFEIEYCPMHAALPELIAALKLSQDRLETLIDAEEATDNDFDAFNAGFHALAKAGIQ
jgi:hypothetical protein